MRPGLRPIERTEAADHAAIAALTHLHETAFDAGDVDGHMATWGPTLRMRSPFGDHDDHAGYRDWVTGFSERMQAMGGTRHLITNAAAAVEGETATQTAYLTVLGRTTDGGGPSLLATARFEDELTRTPEGWRFASRTLHLDQDAAAFAGD